MSIKYYYGKEYFKSSFVVKKRNIVNWMGHTSGLSLLFYLLDTSQFCQMIVLKISESFLFNLRYWVLPFRVISR